jgi:hypothetical protein
LVCDVQVTKDKIYYTKAVYDKLNDSYSPGDLSQINPDGSDNKLITKKGYIFIGINDKYIIAIDYTSGYTYLIDRKTFAEEVRLYIVYEDMTLSDDGKRIIMNSFENKKGLAVYDIESKKLTTLFSGAAVLPREYGGKLYFYNADDSNKLYSVKNQLPVVRKMVVKLIDDQGLWDKHIEDSVYGTLFHKWDFLKIIEKHSESKLYPYGVFRGEELVCLFPLFVKQFMGLRMIFSPPPGLAVPYLGFVMVSAYDRLKQRRKESYINDVADGMARPLAVQWSAVSQ